MGILTSYFAVFSLILHTNAQLGSNATIQLPAGASNHGDSNLVYVPTQWTDIIIFFLGNYFAHAATIISVPGSSLHGTIMSIVLALLFPVLGVVRGYRAISRMAIFASSDLEIAAKAGALCKIIRKDHYPRTNQEFILTRGCENTEIPWPDKLYVGKVHGRVRLPEGYGLAIVPGNTKFENNSMPKTSLISDYNAVKILVAVGQLCFAIATLYRTKGDQINRYGYAAFGLTVTQYALMSLINLLGNLLCPQYPAVYLVETSIMLEACAKPNAIFEGVVGKLLEETTEREVEAQTTKQEVEARIIEQEMETQRTMFELGLSHTQMLQVKKRIWLLPIILLPTACSIAVIQVLSQFRDGGSTLTQRVVLMTWLVMGGISGALDKDMPVSEKIRQREYKGEKQLSAMKLSRFYFVIKLLLVSTPSIWGFIVVGQMLSEYGICTRV